MFGGKWAGDKNIGVDALPMFLKPNFSYDKKLGFKNIGSASRILVLMRFLCS